MTLLTVILALVLPWAQKPLKTPHRAICGVKCRTVRPYNEKLTRMAWCESRERWYINTGNGYYGGLQFDLSTWESVGGRGYPHQNSILEQKYRAVRLIRKRGYTPWPICGYA
jgi:Transglycosylase-like domain